MFWGRPGPKRSPGCGQLYLDQPVLIGDSVGTASWVLTGSSGAKEERTFGSVCHGAGRANTCAVVDSAEHAGLARRVARLAPLICVKG